RAESDKRSQRSFPSPGLRPAKIPFRASPEPESPHTAYASVGEPPQKLSESSDPIRSQTPSAQVQLTTRRHFRDFQSCKAQRTMVRSTRASEKFYRHRPLSPGEILKLH